MKKLLLFAMLCCPTAHAQRLEFGPGVTPGKDRSEAEWKEVYRQQHERKRERARLGIPDAQTQFEGQTDWVDDPSETWLGMYRQIHGREWQPARINRDVTRPDEAVTLRALVADLRKQIEVLQERIHNLERDIK